MRIQVQILADGILCDVGNGLPIRRLTLQCGQFPSAPPSGQEGGSERRSDMFEFLKPSTAGQVLFQTLLLYRWFMIYFSARLKFTLEVGTG